jgi:hypothetical protein
MKLAIIFLFVFSYARFVEEATIGYSAMQVCSYFFSKYSFTNNFTSHGRVAKSHSFKNHPNNQ